MSEASRATRPLPAPDDPLVVEFCEHCNRGELCFQRCENCGAWRHLPRFVCARCGSDRWGWAPSRGRGRIYSWTITHQPLVRGFPEPVPYAVVVVELDEGVRMTTNVVGCANAELRIGMPLEVTFEQVSEAVAIPKFRRST